MVNAVASYQSDQPFDRGRSAAAAAPAWTDRDMPSNPFPTDGSSRIALLARRGHRLMLPHGSSRFEP